MNNIHHAYVYGGLLGLLFSTPGHALRKKIKEINSLGEEVVFIIPDATNAVIMLLYILILIVTLLLWCPQPGYLIITKQRQDSL